MPGSYETPKYGSYEDPKAGSYETPASVGYEAPNAASYDAAASQGYQAPSASSYAAPSGQPVYQAPNSSAPSTAKSKVAAGLLAIFLGSLGIHKFYLGYTSAGIIMLLVSIVGAIVIVGPLVMSVIGIIEGILYLTKSDQEFYQIYVVGDRPWF